MNPLTNAKNLQKMNKLELEMGYAGKRGSWHDQYKNSAWIFVGGLPYDLTEGDVISVFSQYGEIANINLVRDKSSGKSKGFAFICYEDQRSTVLAVDNFNTIKICGRTIRVDHVADYKAPDTDKIEDEEVKDIVMRGCAPEVAVEREKVLVVKPEVKSDVRPKKDKHDDRSDQERRRERESSSSRKKHSKKEKRSTRSRSRSRSRDRRRDKHVDHRRRRS
ncbi:unnamed protein product [Notodromas monacha]|uniref:RNA-binding motif protein, X-linked 2 n=1 Tax=Notodromas monacha TaxID=399045 RepID=A0A7R9BEZ7_9CRUS|nr:unnamed protein product [Notodromas monacha]CAG0914140.1 unnamed protein product [Notodromas monacha]